MLTQDRPTPTNLNSPSGTEQLLLKRPVNVKAVVTPLWKDEAEQQLRLQASLLDEQLTQLGVQVQRMIKDLSERAIQVVGAENSTIAESQAQIKSIQVQANDRRNELMEQKIQVLEQLKEIQGLELGGEVDQGQVENFFYAKQGDHLIRRMQVEVLLRDGVIEDIRGEL